MTEQQKLDKAICAKIERRFRDNFNRLMPGVAMGETSFEDFKKRYPTLLKVIIFSIKEASEF